MWYGKGPGVDRCGDVFKHAQRRRHVEARRRAGAGRRRPRRASPRRCRTRRDHMFSACDDPGALPGRRAGVSSTSACTAGRCRATRAAGSASRRSPTRSRARPRSTSTRRACRSSCPTTSRCRRTALHIRWPDRAARRRSARLQDYKVYAALAYARANRLNRIVIDRPQRAARHHHPRQGLPRRAAGAATTSASTERDAAEIGLRLYKVGMPWPLEPRGRAPVRRGPGGDPGRRGKAPDHRVPAEGAALQLARRRAPARRRQVRRERRVGAPARRLAAAADRRADAGDDRPRDRRSASRASTASARDRAAALAFTRQPRKRRSPKPRIALAAHALLLLGLPAQHLDQRARGQPRAGRHRLPLHGAAGWTATPRPSRRWAARARLDRAGAVHRRAAHLRQHRRRHLLPLRAAGDPRGGRRRASTSPTRSSTTTRWR